MIYMICAGKDGSWAEAILYYNASDFCGQCRWSNGRDALFLH